MKILECTQLSKEWFDLKRGRPSASGFGNIITPKQMKLSASHKGYIEELLGDAYDSLYPREGYCSRDMLEGVAREEESRRWYAFDTDQEVTQVGLCESDCGRFLCSPDALVGDDGVLELKNPTPRVHIGYMLAGDVVPDDYRAQCSGHLIVTGRKWVDFVSYCPPLKPFKVRVTSDLFTAALANCLDQFWDAFCVAQERIRQ